MITLSIVAVIELITGPPGSNAAPMSGFTGSYAEAASFFGLFRTQRWVVFLALALIIWGLANFWIARGAQVRQRVSRVVAKPKSVAQRGPVRWSSAVALLVIAILVPHIVTAAFWQSALVTYVAIYILLAIGLNVVVGFAGLLDLGYVAFYAIGAYTTAWVTGALPTPALFHHPLNPFWAIPIAIAIVMIAGVLLGAPTLRLRGDYLAIVTLGFGEIVTIFANNLYGITGGSEGTKAIPHPSIHLGPIKYAWGLTPVPYYYLTLAFVVLFLIVFSLLERSRIGRAWTAIREDEVAAESIGINPLKFKVMAFAIGAASAGFAGVITASADNYVFPSSFTLQFSINILVLVILGGMGSIAGVVLGAIIIQVIQAYLNHSPPAGYEQPDLYIYLGALLITMMIVRPAGLIPSRRRKREIGLSERDHEGHLDEVLTGDDT
jgi:branched-chain amino acid transport system permease protein